MTLSPFVLVISATELETAPLRARLLPSPDAGPRELAARSQGDRAGRGERGITTWPAQASGVLAGLAVCVAAAGMGKANAAAAVAAVVAGRTGDVRLVLNVGIGGAYPDADLPVGTAVMADSELDIDLGVGRHPGWQGVDALNVPGEATTNRIDLATPLLRRVKEATGIPALPFATSDSVTASREHASYLSERFGVAVESMEGAGAARAALALGVPFLEVRGISNEAGDRDKSRWDVRAAVAASCSAAEDVVRAVGEVAGWTS